MPITACTVSDVLKDAQGELLTSTVMTFERMASLQGLDGDHLISPVVGTGLAASVSVTTDATTAAFSVDIMPGVYRVLYQGKAGIEQVTATVPVQATANLRGIIGQATTIDSTIAASAAASAAEAEASALSAGAQPYANRAAAVAAVAAGIPASITKIGFYDGLVPSDSFRALWLTRSAGATSIADMPGWLPLGDIYLDHYVDHAVPGTTDMTDALEAAALSAISEVGGGVINMFDKPYLLTRTATIDPTVGGTLPNSVVNKRHIAIRGHSPHASAFVRNTDYGDTIYATGNSATGFELIGFDLFNVQFRSEGLTTSGDHLVLNGVYSSFLTNTIFRNGFGGIRGAGAAQVVINNIRMLWDNLYGGSVVGRRLMQFTDWDDAGVERGPGDIFIDNYNLRTNGTNGNVECCVEINAADGIFFGTGHFGGATKANVWLNSTTAGGIGLVLFDGAMSDAGIGHGVLVSTGVGGGKIRNIEWRGGNLKGGGGVNKGIGFYLDATADVHTVSLAPSFITEYDQQGFLCDSPLVENIALNGADVRGNSYNNVGVYAGVQVEEGQKFRMIGGKSGGQNTGPTPATQAYGVLIGANVTDWLVADVDLLHNVSGPALINATALPNGRIVDCLSDASATVASSGTLVPPPELAAIYVTGTTQINNIRMRWPGARLSIRFADALTIGNGGNITHAGDLVTRAGQVITFESDGTAWHPVAGHTIMSSGNNANGSWIRFADGTQRCRHRLTTTAAIGTACLGGFRNTGQTWTLPKEFATGDLPVMEGMPGALTSASILTNSVTATAASVFHFAPASQASAALVAHMTVEGNWL